MATLTKSYTREEAARLAVETLRAASGPPRGIWLLSSRPLHDRRREPVGGFAGPLGPDAPVGTFAGQARRRSDDTGSFSGDRGQRRRGSFGDVERVMVVTYKADVEHSRITGYRGIRLLLRRVALEADAVDRLVAELNRGHTIVLADVPEIASEEVEAQLGRLAA